MMKKKNQYDTPGLREKYKTRLKTIIEKKFKTTFIGILDRFEQEFGELWGADIDFDDELNETEKKNKRTWNDLRTSILDHGHNQARAALVDIDQYDVIWNR